MLLVDDEQMIRWSLAETLRGWGYVPLEAATVAEAISTFEHQLPAAALLGSTAEKVCRMAPCPVLVTRPLKPAAFAPSDSQG